MHFFHIPSNFSRRGGRNTRFKNNCFSVPACLKRDAYRERNGDFVGNNEGKRLLL